MMNTTVKKFIYSALLMGILHTVAQAQHAPSLFQAVEQETAIGAGQLSVAYRQRVVVRQRQTVVNFDLLLKPSQLKKGQSLDLQAAAQQEDSKPAMESTRFVLDLFDDVALTLVLDRAENMSPDGSTIAWFGRIEEVSGSSAILVTAEGVMVGNITLPGQAFYQIRFREGGVHVIREIDPGKYGREMEPKPQVIPPGAVEQDSSAMLGNRSSADDASFDAQSYDESGSTIDVMVVYTPAARSANGGTLGMNTLIDLAVTETNTGYGNSGVVQRINLVHRQEVSYTESTPPNSQSTIVFDDGLDDLEGTSDGEIDNVHTLRNDYAADIVSLFVHDPVTNWCGKGNIMYTESHSFENQAFNVVDWDCATGYYSFAHEMAHNQGGKHDRPHDNADGVFSYSHGYQDPEEDFRTIMSYDCPGDCDRVNYWSNPDIDYVVGGTNYGPMGIVYTSSDSADMRRSHNNTRDTVANWRPRYVYVDKNFVGTETGLSANPFNTLPLPSR
jgi:hypothetical protein